LNPRSRGRGRPPKGRGRPPKGRGRGQPPKGRAPHDELYSQAPVS